MSSRTRTAARCTVCNRAMAVWRSTDGDIVPIGTGQDCPCGGTSFRLLSSAAAGGT